MVSVSAEPCCTCFFAIYTDRHLSGALLPPSPIRPTFPRPSPFHCSEEGREGRTAKGTSLYTTAWKPTFWPLPTTPPYFTYPEPPAPVEATPTRLHNGRAQTTQPGKRRKKPARANKKAAKRRSTRYPPYPPQQMIYTISSTSHELIRHAHPTIECALCASSDPRVP